MSNLRIDNIAPSAGGTYRNAPRGIAAAWVNFNGTGTVAIRDSENVGSITDNGTGNYTVNLTAAMTDANYVALASSQQTSSTTAMVTWAPRISGLATTSFKVSGVPENSTGGGGWDVLELRCAAFGDLA
jgi:hypothetical protein